MATAERNRVALTARLRRPGPGTFERASRAFPSTLRRGKHAGLQPHHRRAIFSRFATSDETRFHQAVDHYDTEKSAARGVRVVARGRVYQREVRRNSRVAGSWAGEEDEALDSLLGQNLLRPH